MAGVVIGPWTLTSSEQPDIILEGSGFTLAAAGVLLNTSKGPVEVFASVEPDPAPAPGSAPATGQPAVPAPVQGVVQSGRAITLSAPPLGYSWVCGWVTRRTEREWMIWTVGVVLGVSGLTGLGIADVVGMVKRAAKKRRR